MIEIEKNKNGKCLVISVFTLPDDDELIKRPFIYWHTRMEYAVQKICCLSPVLGFMQICQFTFTWVISP